MHAAKHFDPQVGLDFHWTMLGLIGPFPIPTPHIGIVLDPFDYIPIIGGTVHVNGVKRATAGTGGLDVHIPLGAWLPTMKMPGGPQWDDEIFMGSMTVVADGDPLSRIAMPVLDCNFVGLVNPFRPRKPQAPQLSLSLPTAVNLAIPNHVNVGGPPMISIMGMAFKGLFAGLGRLRKLKAVQRALDGAKGKWSKLFANMEPGFLKCKVLRAEPVDIRTGAVSVTHEDFSIPGRLPLAWTRRYRSDAIDHAGVCGWGWTTPADIRLEVGEDGVVFHPLQGPPAVYERLPLPGEGLIDPIDGARLTRVKAAQGNAWADELHLRTKDDVVHVFAAPPANVVPLPGQPARHLRIERLEDRCGNAWTFEREGEHLLRIVERGLDTSPGRFVEVGAQGGRIHTMALHDPITGTTFPLVRYRQDAQGDLVAALDALDAARTFEYRGHRMVRHTDRVGLSFHYEYDRQARVVHSWGDGGLYDYHFAYHDELHETEVTDSLGHTSLVKFDPDGLPLCEIDPLGGCTFFEYDEWGRTTGVTDPNGLRTGFDYDERGNLVSLTRPDSGVVRIAYSEQDKALAVTDAMGSTWHQTWSDSGQMVSQRTPMGSITAYRYDQRGQVIEMTNPRGALQRFKFDPHGSLSAHVDPAQRRSTFEHDAMGRLLAATDASGQAMRCVLDGKGRRVALIRGDGLPANFTYDAEDQLLSMSTGKTVDMSLQYIGTGHISCRVMADGAGARYEYDTEERLVAVINGEGQAYRFVRDALGRVVEETDYWNQSRRFAYDAGGRLVRSTDPEGRVTRYDVDAMGRVVRKSLPDEMQPGRQSTDEFKYDGNGNLVAFWNQSSRVTREFDLDGRLIGERQNDFKITNVYDAAGNRIRRVTNVGNVVDVEYDLVDQPWRISVNDQLAMEIDRDESGRLTRESLGNGLIRTFQQAPNGMLSRLSLMRNLTSLFETSFQYDAGDRLTARIDSARGTARYRYDAVGRLVEHQAAAGELELFSHDAAGNRLRTAVREERVEQVVGAAAAGTTWCREGVLQGVRYTFDRGGNLTSRVAISEPDRPELQLQWDAERRLIRSRWQGGKRNGQSVRYGYDPLGRRVFKQGPGYVIRYCWDGDQLLAEAREDLQAGAPDATVADSRVVHFDRFRRAAESRAEALRSALEYFYRPATFEPLFMIDGRIRGPATDPLPSLTVGAKSTGTGGLGTLGVDMALPGTNATPAAGRPRAVDAAARLGASGYGQLLGGSAPALHAGDQDDPASQANRSGPDANTSAAGPRLYHYVNDPNGCPIRLVDRHGSIVWEAEIGPWGGTRRLHVGLIDQPIRLQGQFEDLETGLHYNRHRYYDPHAGQFVGADPIGMRGGNNLYAYGPNVQQFIDPLGLAKRPPKSVSTTITAGDYSETFTNVKNGAHAEMVGLNSMANRGLLAGKDVVISDVVGDFFPEGHLPTGICSSCRHNIFDPLMEGGANSVTLPKVIGNKLRGTIHIPSSSFGQARDAMRDIINSELSTAQKSAKAWKVLDALGSCRT